MKELLTSVIFLFVIAGFSQQIPQKYFVAFTDKNGTPYSITNPQAFLTQRAIDRRAAQGIPIIEEDLPVNPTYVAGVAATGVEVFTRCKWFNGITVEVNDDAVLSSIQALPFVQSVTRVTSYNSKKGPEMDWKCLREEELRETGGNEVNQSPASSMNYNYGPSFNQIHMLNGDLLHDMGYRGQGKVIAVLDGGFKHVDTEPCYDSLWANNQILGTRDFVNPGGNVFQENSHGTAVLSTMGCCIPGALIGTAPKASYWLIRTEDMNSENIVEEYNWVVGVEMADSVGADVINSSVGYTTFDNGWMNHTCEDMNGYTNPSTRGANIAASKGMALSIAAGNDGGSSWTCVSSPSDALEALSIAGTDASGNYAYFSSTGIVDGNYVKPNIAAQGLYPWVAYPDSAMGGGIGTSFSSPINAGMIACLWQARPNLDQHALRMVIQESASQFANPDIYLGYGIPDYYNALTVTKVIEHRENGFQVYPNPFSDSFTILSGSAMSGNVEISLITITGQIIQKRDRTIAAGESSPIIINDLSWIKPGIYLLKISSGGAAAYRQLIKL